MRHSVRVYDSGMGIRAPRGFRFEVFPPNRIAETINVSLASSDDRVVGSVSLKWIDNNLDDVQFDSTSRDPKFKRFETHSSLNSDLRGRGLGTLLYAKAIEIGMKNGLNVHSSTMPSKYAVRVWQSRGLRKLYRIQRKNGRYVVLSRRGVVSRMLNLH